MAKNEHPLSRVDDDNVVQRGELARSLMEVFQELRDGTMEIGLASELNNTAGKVLKSHALDLATIHLLHEQASVADRLALTSNNG